MKSFIKKTSWVSLIILILLALNFFFSQFKVYESIYYNYPDFVTAVYSVKSSIALGVFLGYRFLCRMEIFFKEREGEKENDIEESYYSDFPPHQQRVFEERDELEVKYIKLSNFIFGNQIFKDLPEIEQLALKEQFFHMDKYLAVLNKQISRF